MNMLRRAHVIAHACPPALNVRKPAFPRVDLALTRDRGLGAALLLAGACGLCVAWAAWIGCAQLELHVVSTSARIEAREAAAPVEPQVSGRLAHLALTLGHRVEAGDVLAQIDDGRERIALQEARGRLESLRVQLGAVEREVESRERLLQSIELLGSAGAGEARVRRREAEIAAAQADNERARSALLRAAGAVSAADDERRASDAEQRRATAAAAAGAVERVELEYQARRDEGAAEAARVRAQASALQTEIAAATENVRRLEHEVELRKLRAPVAGQIGDLAPVQIGTVVDPGFRLATVVPVDRPRVIAELAAAESVGRVRPGQSARLRLEAFPWTQYGAVPVRVERVGQEERDGRVRIELAIDEEHAPRGVPLEHGMRGVVDVVVERSTPIQLALRLAGGWLRDPRAQPGR